MLFTTLLFTLAIASTHAYKSVATYEKALKRFVNAFASPNNELQAAAINSSIFSDDIIGRVDISENYVGRELNTEYIFGLFANAKKAVENGTTQLIGFPVSTTKLSAAAIDPPLVYGAMLANFSYPTAGFFLPVEIDFMLRYDDKSMAISSYDATFRRFKPAFQYLLPHLLPEIAKEEKVTLTPATNTSVLVAVHAVKSVCTVHEEHCTGKNRQYTSFDECYKFLLGTDFGEPYQAGDDTVICRYLHQYVVPLRPSVHCEHIGKTGGDMCQTRTYLQRVLDNPYTESLLPKGLP